MSKQNLAIITVTLIAGLGIVFFAVRNRSSTSTNISASPMPTPVINVNPNTLPGIQTSQKTPWDIQISTLRDRLAAIGLPALQAEGTTLHIHQHIDIFIQGKFMQIPTGIGINETQFFISPVHTHDTTGVMHVESPVVQTFTLGQFFDIWGVRLTKDCIGGYCTEGDSKLRLYSNGMEVASDPRELHLEPHQEIVIAYGIEKDLPSPIPAQYTFPEGL